MGTNNKGLHHITVLGGDGQRTTDFYLKKFGLRRYRTDLIQRNTHPLSAREPSTSHR